MMTLNLKTETSLAIESFNTLLNGFVEQIGELQRLSLLRGAAGSNEELRKELREFSMKIGKLEEGCDELEVYVKQEKDVVQETVRTIATIKQQQRRAQHLRLQMGAVTLEPSPEEASSENESQCGKDTGLNEIEVTDQDKENLRDDNSNSDLRSLDDSVKECQGEKSETKSSLLVAPNEDDLESVPRYMRSRLTHAQLVETVNVFNESLQSKYKIMNMPRSQQGTRARQKFEEWRKQETFETQQEGLSFVTKEDVHDLAKKNNLDFNTVKISLQVLRYCGGLRLHGEGGVNRFIVN